MIKEENASGRILKKNYKKRLCSSQQVQYDIVCIQRQERDIYFKVSNYQLGWIEQAVPQQQNPSCSYFIQGRRKVRNIGEALS